LLLNDDPRPGPNGFLIAEDGTELVGTATVFSFQMWVRGARLPCQGPAWVGTSKVRRRRKVDGKGIAWQIMHAVLKRARDEGQALSALMPFRGSYYEHFGYGIVERRCEWTVPISLLPEGPCDGFRFAQASDRAAVAALHQRSVERGQCDIERSPARWEHIVRNSTDGFELIESDGPNSPARVSVFYNQFQVDGKDILRIMKLATENMESFRGLLHFLSTLRDQYYAIQVTLPADVPLNWLVRERQLPHRLVNHPYPEVRPYTRMQVRILDHVKLLESMHLPEPARGQVVIAIHECEGHVSKLRLDFADRRISAASTDASAELECSDVTWAAVALGELPAQTAAEIGLLKGDPAKASLLTTLSRGPVPFCEEYF
jgi:predicted acetyltransferase